MRVTIAVATLLVLSACTNHYSHYQNGEVDGRPIRCWVELANPFLGRTETSKIICTENRVVVVDFP